MVSRKVHSTYDGLYDRVKGDKDDFIAEDIFRSKVDELVDIEYIETSTLDDFTLYSAKAGLKWSDFVHIDDSIKKAILLLLVENPTTYRSAWSFYLVFYSPKFNNVYFKKGSWESIEK